MVPVAFGDGPARDDAAGEGHETEESLRGTQTSAAVVVVEGDGVGVTVAVVERGPPRP